MKKLISILLVMMMILCMGTAAFADTTNITIAGDAGRIYKAYELLELTTSLKCDHVAGATHESGCYNYAYTVNEDYREILQEEVYDNVKADYWNAETNPKPVNADGVTDAQILDYLSKLAGDNAEIDDTYGTLRAAADRIYRAIKTAGIDADLNMKEGENEAVQGYWLIADVTNLAGADKANSLVMVNTKGQDTLTITPKTALPEFEKKVKDINDSNPTDIHDNGWGDSADHDKGDTVPFKLTATVPANVSSYGTYKMVFHDKIDAGLDINYDSIKVYKYDSKAAADAAKVPNGTLIDKTKYTLNTTPTDGCSFELTLNVVLTGTEAASAGNAFVVYYEATLKDNAVIGGSGNSNTAHLVFSNDPYDAAKTGQTQKDTVKVYTYELVINKVDAAGNALPGAGFTLYKKDAAGNYDDSLGVVGTPDTTGTTFTWTHLDDGAYKLVETTVPADYNKMEDKEFTIKATHDVTQTTLTSTLGKVTGGTITDKVTNLKGTILPSTGAKGTMMLIGGGSVFIVLAAVFMITRKKMSVYED